MKTLTWNCSVSILCALLLSVGCSGGGASSTTEPGAQTAQSGLFEPARYSLPANSAVLVRLNTGVVSSDATVGQAVRGDVMADVMSGGHVLIPAGSEVRGSVTTVKPAKHFGGQAMVAVGFDSVILPNGEKVPVSGGMSAYAKSQKARDTGAIVGGTLGGAVLGRVIGKDTKGAVTGAVVGGGVGTAVASKKGDEAHLPAGTSTRVQTRQSLVLPAV